jgi:hypothetical protein
MQLLPLDAGFNRAILAIASRLFPTGYDVSPEAPSTFRALCDHLDAGRPMIVYDGASESTIYACPEVNFAFRAWHDYCHWKGRCDFSLNGERRAMEMQREHMRKLFGIVPRWEALLECEIIGQGEFYAKTKTFVADQRAFALAWLAERGFAANENAPEDDRNGANEFVAAARLNCGLA